jgi:UrcA family protein
VAARYNNSSRRPHASSQGLRYVLARLSVRHVSADTSLRIVCENVEPIVWRDEATEHSSRVVFQHSYPLQPFSLWRYLGHVRMTDLSSSSRRHDMLMHQSRLAPSRVLAVALAIGAASLIADIASATDAQVSTVVNYRDLDPSRAADAQRLYARLKYASEKVCGTTDLRDLKLLELRDGCYADALNKAVEKVNEPTLTALHAAEPRVRVARKS